MKKKDSIQKIYKEYLEETDFEKIKLFYNYINENILHKTQRDSEIIIFEILFSTN